MSGKEPVPDDYVEEPVHGRGQGEGSSAGTSAGAASSSSAPPRLLPDILRERQRLPLQIREPTNDGGSGLSETHVQPGDEASGPLQFDGKPGRSRKDALDWCYATAEIERKGKKVLSPIPSLPESQGSSPRDPVVPADPETGTSSSAAGRGLELQQMKSKKVKKSLSRKLINYSKIKIFGRKVRRISNRTSRGSLSPELPKKCHVDHQTIPWEVAFKHYFDDLITSVRGGVMPTNSVELQYKKLRTVVGDGECFYRGFIFSYLEQVLDRRNTHEESRLLSAIERVAIQYENLGWTFEFSRSHEAFKRLINSVMRWKRKKFAPTDYSKKKLLDFFCTYDTTEDIFVFLRLVTATWICSHTKEFERIISELTEDYSLKDWCFEHVIPRRSMAGDVQMRGLSNALGIALRVEQLRIGKGQDICTGPPPPLVVTLLSTGNHYDIIYA